MTFVVFDKHPWWPWESPADFGEPAESPTLQLELYQEYATQTEVVSCRLTSYEGIRRMTRPQFRQLLHERLQEFGDAILAAWEKQGGGGEEEG